MSNRPKGRPGGNPSRPDRQSADSVRAAVAAAYGLMPDLSEQFAALDVGLQQRVLRLRDLVADMSHAEKTDLRVQINGIRRFDSTGLEFAEVLSALDSVVLTVDRLAAPEVDGEPTGDLAQRFLDDYAMKSEREG